MCVLSVITRWLWLFVRVVALLSFFMQVTVIITVAPADQAKLKYKVPALTIHLPCRSLSDKGHRTALTVVMFPASSDPEKLDAGAPFAGNSDLVLKAACLATTDAQMTQEHQTNIVKVRVDQMGQLVFTLPESSFRPDSVEAMNHEPIQVKVNDELLLGGGHSITVNARNCTLQVTGNGDSTVAPVWRNYDVNVEFGSDFKVCLSPSSDVLLCVCEFVSDTEGRRYDSIASTGAKADCSRRHGLIPPVQQQGFSCTPTPSRRCNNRIVHYIREP